MFQFLLDLTGFVCVECTQMYGYMRHANRRRSRFHHMLFYLTTCCTVFLQSIHWWQRTESKYF